MADPNAASGLPRPSSKTKDKLGKVKEGIRRRAIAAGYSGSKSSVDATYKRSRQRERERAKVPAKAPAPSSAGSIRMEHQGPGAGGAPAASRLPKPPKGK